MNNREVNRLDVESIQFHYKVREGYQLLLNQYPNRIKRINAENELNEVFHNALEVVSSFIEARKTTVD